MKFFVITTLIFLMSLGFINQALASSSWVSVGSERFTAGEAGDLSFAIDSNDIPYVAFIDVANSDKATVMKYASGSWSIVGTAGFSADGIGFPKIAFNSSNEPYVSFQDGANSNKATVMKYNGSSWDIVGTAGFSTDRATYSSLAIDSFNPQKYCLVPVEKKTC
jgi:hypothetical protein